MAVTLLPIHPSTPLRTRKGTVSVYDEAYLGPLVEPARTNKVTCRKANPIDTTGLTIPAGLTVAIVNDSEALAAAKIDKTCGGNVYKLTATAATYVLFGGDTGNTQPHSMRIWLRGVASGTTFGLSGGLTTAATITNSYKEFKRENITPGSSTAKLAMNLGNGDIVYAILPQLEEGAFLTSPIALDSTGADPLTALTRPAANLTRPTAGTALAALNNWGIRLRFRPTAAGQTAVLWGSYTDADNATRIDLAASTLTYTKRLSGSNHVAQASLTHAAATLYDVIIYQHSVSGMGIAFRSWNGSEWSAWSAWTALTGANGIANAAIAPTYQWGALNNASHASSNIPFVDVIELRAHEDPAVVLLDLLSKGRI